MTDLVPTLDSATGAPAAAAGDTGSADARSSGKSSLTGTKGGSGVWQRIISEMPEHDVYIEPFWGRGTIARLKRPAVVTIGVDLDPAAIASGEGLATMFRADGMQWLKDYFHLRPGADGEYRVADRAAQSSVAAVSLDSAAPAAVSTFGGASWKRHFVYLDPPYLGVPSYYKHELTDAEHRDLCRLFRALPCPAALSGYFSPFYAFELDGCRSIQIPTVNRAGKRVTEWLWLNYDPPLRYHDVRFVGCGRRERERIRRRVKNWSRGLASLSPAERQAVWEACDAVYRGMAGGDSGSCGGGHHRSQDNAARTSPPDDATEYSEGETT